MRMEKKKELWEEVWIWGVGLRAANVHVPNKAQQYTQRVRNMQSINVFNMYKHTLGMTMEDSQFDWISKLVSYLHITGQKPQHLTN